MNVKLNQPNPNQGLRIGLALIVSLTLLLSALIGLQMIDSETARAAPPVSPLQADGVSSALTVTTLSWATGSTGAFTETLYEVDPDGNRFTNSGRVMLILSNGYTETITVTVETPGTNIVGLSIDDLIIAVPADTKYYVPWLPTVAFNQTISSTRNQAALSYSTNVTDSTAASMTIGLVQFQ